MKVSWQEIFRKALEDSGKRLLYKVKAKKSFYLPIIEDRSCLSKEAIEEALKQLRAALTMEKHSPEKIVEILHSIKELSVKDGELNVLFVDSTAGWESIPGFIPGSFTRKLLELIEDHLLNDETNADN